MKYFIILFLIISNSSFSQKVINYEIEQTGEIFLTPDIAIPKVNNGYTIWLP
ncbi:MAG: hypothetical protein KDD00_13435 [Ignavibacteriae bacterium]|nr:hypothetical protein [Ignavibacteriota bacterium]